MSSKTERRRAAALLVSSTDGVIEVDKDWTVLYVSNHHQMLVPQNAIGRNLWDLFPRSAAPWCHSECRRAVETGEAAEFTQYHEPTRAWYFVRAVPYGDGLIICFRDITASKEAEIALLRSRETLSQVLDVLPIGVCVIDGDGTIASANCEAKRIWGGTQFTELDPAHLRKRWRHDTGLPIKPDEWNAIRAIRDDRSILGEILDIEAFDGQRRVVRSSAIPLHDGDGKLSGCISVNQEITGEKRVEAALEKALMDAQKANQSKSKLVAGLAHDLHQPLLGIRLNLSHLMADLPADKVDTIRMLIRSVESAEQMVDALTEVTAIEAGSVRPKPVNFDLSEMIRAICREFGAAADDKGLRLSCRAGAAPAIVRSDPLLLQRAVRNLVSNAVRYTDQGAVLTGLRRRRDHFIVEVWDTGCGFHQSALPHVLGEAIDPRAPSPKGFGIGLAAVGALSRLLGITISAHSRVGAGSVFRLRVAMAP